MEMENANKQEGPIQAPQENLPFHRGILNQKGSFIIILGIILIILVIGIGGYYFGTRNKQTVQDKTLNNVQPSPTSRISTTPPATMSKTPYLAAFMRKGEIWIKNFLSNQEYKVSETAKVEEPVFSPNAKYLYYFEIVHAGGGFPRYGLFVSDVNGYSEKTFKMVANQHASKLKWSSDGNYLGMVLFANDIPGGSQYFEEAFIYDTGSQKETSLGKLTKGTSEGDAYLVNASCDKLELQYTEFCKEYVSYIAVPRNDVYKGGYKNEEYSKSKYTKSNYKLTKSERLENGLVVLEYYTGEPQNPESKWGIGGGVFIPGYDVGVTETYTILIDEQAGKILQELPMAIDSDFVFDANF